MKRMRATFFCVPFLVGCVRFGYDQSDLSSAPVDDRALEAAQTTDGAGDAPPTGDGKLPTGDGKPPNLDGPVNDLPKTKADVLPVCSPPCRKGDVCCVKNGTLVCVDDEQTDSCACDLATGVPCGFGTICCNKGSGPRCYDDDLTENCICDPTTGKPCKAGWTACCDKGSGPTCIDDDMTQGCACDPTTGKPCGFGVSCCPTSGGKYACGHCK
jgi:hypothetical protein